MIEPKYAEVVWALNAYCQHRCTYCPAEYKNGELAHSVDQYLMVIEKLQQTRYQHYPKIHWKLGGGEPLHFPYLSIILKKIREKPAIVRLDTSGDDTWFSFTRIASLVDRVKLTYHEWQNDDVFELVLEQCKEKNITVSIAIPLLPGKIFESREKIKYFEARGYNCQEQILFENDGRLHLGYSLLDENRIFGKPDDCITERYQPQYIDLSVINATDPVYTGKPCYAGVDWLSINPNGFASYGQCGGRNEHYNVFDPNWQPPNSWFNCTVNQCRSDQDRRKIRINV
jgi:hypothetical protein